MIPVVLGVKELRLRLRPLRGGTGRAVLDPRARPGEWVGTKEVPVRKHSKFEDLIVWQKSRRLAVDVYRLVRGSQLGNDYPFRDQIQRAVISIAADIAEGSERGSDKEFAYFLRVAKASAGELRSHLILAVDVGLCPPGAADPLQDEIRQIGRMLAVLIQRQT